MSPRAPRPLALAVTAFAEDLAPATPLARVQRVWEQAAGPAVARACRPTAEREGVLTVTCAEAVWSQELELMGPEIVDRLNRALGGEPLRRLRCRTG